MNQFLPKLIIIILFVALDTSCGSRTTTAEVHQTKSSIVFTEQANKSTANAQLLCSRIPEIQVFPMKGDRGEDSVYDAFMDAGDAVLPCLIEKVTDTTKIQDPRQEPGFPDIQITLGDIAYFLIIDITKIPFTELLPPKVQKRYKDQGVYAYFKFVQKSSNRKQLQDNVDEWYRMKRR